MICGQKEESIRKSYFKGKITKLLNDIQASGDYSVEEYGKLKDFLQELKDKDLKLNERFDAFVPKLDEEDNILDELNQESLSEAEIASLEKEKQNRENAVALASKLLRGLFMKFYDRSQQSPNEDELMDLAFEMLSLEYYVLREKIYSERLYRKKIVEIEKTGRQRKLAEELAKTTIEYRNFAMIEGLLDSIKEFIMLAKKRYRDKL